MNKKRLFWAGAVINAFAAMYFFMPHAHAQMNNPGAPGNVVAGNNLSQSGNIIGISAPVTVANGGTGTNTSTGTGSVVLSNSPTINNGSLSGTDVSAANVTATGAGSPSTMANILAPAAVSQANGNIVVPGGYLGPLGNLNASGSPYAISNNLILMNSMPSGEPPQSTLHVQARNDNATVGSITKTALYVSDTAGINDGAKEDVGLFTMATNQPAGAKPVAVYSQIDRKAPIAGQTSYAPIWASVMETDDDTDLPSSGTAAAQIVEFDNTADGVDDGSSPGTYGNSGIRKGLFVKFAKRGNDATSVAQFSDGLWISTDGNSLTYLNSGVGFAKPSPSGTQIFNDFDCRGTVVPPTGWNNGAGDTLGNGCVVMNRNQFIDFANELGTLAPNTSPQRPLFYKASDSSLEYWNETSRSVLFSIGDTGIVTAQNFNATSAVSAQTLSLGGSNSHANINDTSGTGSAYMVYLNNGTTEWRTRSNSSTGDFTVDRYVGGSTAGSPISIANATGIVTLANGVKLGSTTFANLPACNSGTNGLMMGISDGANSPSYNSTASGGGSSSYPVFCNGSNWTAH